jgi:hypothetical protein
VTKPVLHILLTGFFALGVAAFPDTGSAHSGGLNAQGCHAGSQPYHCHRAQNEMVGNRLRCDLGSRSQECSGARAPQPSSAEVVAIQQQLRRHCPSLSASFVDGVVGPATIDALLRFQVAYGLDVDGRYGPQTAAALTGATTGRCP